MRFLFPPLQPYVNHTLVVNELHSLHIEECGKPSGIPVLFLHGGPGAGCLPDHRRYFNPEQYRIILFDQRGCGRSTPHAELQQNTTDDLVADIEKIREHLGIEKWVLFGGSWGSTLALVYAQTHPDRVLGMMLRGIFLCRERDVDWFYQDGASHIYPDHWQEYVAPIPVEERDDMVKAYYSRLSGTDEIARMSAAKAWSVWEARCATLLHDQSLERHFSQPYAALSLARIECHYFTHDSFLQPDQILENMSVLQDIPATIVHGRYDMVCPLEQAWALYQAWPKSELHIIDKAGHSAAEPGIVDALISATEHMHMQLK